MSDTDEGTTDADDGGFDKEAERERLREKYERDQQRRESTQRMSELLLKGATMTNQHCGECGSPLFRHDGEVFCPTCQGTREVVDEDADEEIETDEAIEADETTGADEEIGAEEEFAVSEFEPDERQPAGGDERQPADRDDGRRTRDVGAEAGSRGSGGDAPGRQPRSPAGAGDDRTISKRSQGGDQDRSRATPAGPDGSPDRDPLLDSSRGPSPHGSNVDEAPSLSQAKASLRRAIVSLSEQAAQSDDPGRAHALLEGTREAAEALAALGGDKE